MPEPQSPSSSRRRFLRQLGLAGGGLAALASASSPAADPPQCEVETPPADGSQKRAAPYDFPSKTTRIRKEVWDLSDDEVKHLADAYRKLKALPADDVRSWCKQANLHDRHCSYGPGDRPPHSDAYWGQIHFGWSFLPWHRAYLYFFESILGELVGDAGFALPYWDWSKNPKLPDFFFAADPQSPLHSLHHPVRRVQNGQDSIEKDPAVRN